ncbi:MAG: hypothetical protein ABSD85_17585 [Acidimicrobiales bacterium]
MDAVGSTGTDDAVGAAAALKTDGSAGAGDANTAGAGALSLCL